MVFRGRPMPPEEAIDFGLVPFDRLIAEAEALVSPDQILEFTKPKRSPALSWIGHSSILLAKIEGQTQDTLVPQNSDTLIDGQLPFGLMFDHGEARHEIETLVTERQPATRQHFPFHPTSSVFFLIQLQCSK